jgi:hypothetical protein
MPFSIPSRICVQMLDALFRSALDVLRRTEVAPRLIAHSNCPRLAECQTMGQLYAHTRIGRLARERGIAYVRPRRYDLSPPRLARPIA